MRLLHLFHLTLLPFLSAEEIVKSPQSRASLLTFSDETQLQGKILSVDLPSQSLKLRSPQLETETTLKTNGLYEIEFPKTFTPPETHHYAIATSKPRIKERQKDSIRGRLIALDDTTITLDTWYAGTLKLKREMIGALDIFPHSPSLYSGPNTLKEWVTSNGVLEENWTLQDRTLTSKSRHGIARKVPIPGRAKISFTASWKANPNFSFIFLSNEGDSSYPEVNYRLNVHRNSLTISRDGPERKQNNFLARSQHTISRRGQEKATFDIYLDRAPGGQNGIFIDGEKSDTWTGTDDTEGMGDWIHFVPKNELELKITNISITEWNGALPKGQQTENETIDDSLKDLEGETISLINGDTLIGQIKKISDGTLQTKTIYGEIGIPINRIRAINVAGEHPDKPQPILLENEIRAWFHEGGFIHMKLVAMDHKTIRGRSQVFTIDEFDENQEGEATFDLSAFSRIEFNVWPRELARRLYGKETVR